MGGAVGGREEETEGVSFLRVRNLGFKGTSSSLGEKDTLEEEREREGWLGEEDSITGGGVEGAVCYFVFCE